MAEWQNCRIAERQNGGMAEWPGWLPTYFIYGKWPEWLPTSFMVHANTNTGGNGGNSVNGGNDGNSGNGGTAEMMDGNDGNDREGGMYYYIRYTSALSYIRTIYSTHDDDTDTDTDTDTLIFHSI